MEPLTTMMMVSGGMELLGGIIQGLSYKPQTRNLSPSEKHIEYMVERYRTVRDNRQAAAEYAAAFTGMPVSEFSSTAGQISLTSPSDIYTSPTETEKRDIPVYVSDIGEKADMTAEPYDTSQVDVKVQRTGRELYQMGIGELETQRAEEEEEDRIQKKQPRS